MSDLIEYTIPIWRGLNMRALKVDEAYIVVKSYIDKIYYLYTLSEECYTCPYKKLQAITPIDSINDTNLTSIPINIAQLLSLKLFNKNVGKYAFDNETATCSFEREDLKEFGVYNLTIFQNGSCHFETDKPGVDVNQSLLTCLLLVLLMFIFLKLTKCVWRTTRTRTNTDEINNDENVTNVNITTVEKRTRLKSLDVFRGFSIVLMIFVNSGGGHYWWIEHASWNGLHIADIVFPSFLWIMGVCIPISIKSQLQRGITKRKICHRIIYRSIKLFLIGLCLNSIYGPNISNLRIMGVLQRFGIAYLVCGIVHTFFAKIEQDLLPRNGWRQIHFDLISFRGEFATMLVLIIVHLALVFGLKIPGNCPRGYLGPGGMHANAAYKDCIGGTTGYLDRIILGQTHIYQHPTAKFIYDSKAFDPEGVFGCLLTIVQVLFGVLAGVIIIIHTNWHERLRRWLVWSFILALLGGILCSFSKEDGLIPLNKNLWSLSFVFVTSSLAFLSLAILYYIVDVNTIWWNGTPFAESGMNAIIMYVGHTIMHRMLPWHWRIGEMNTHFILLLESIWNTALWIGIALYLHSIKFYYSL